MNRYKSKKELRAAKEIAKVVHKQKMEAKRLRRKMIMDEVTEKYTNMSREDYEALIASEKEAEKQRRAEKKAESDKKLKEWGILA